MEVETHPKLLVASPIWHKMKYCLKEFLGSVKSLSYGNYDILLVDNSKECSFFNELEKEEGIIALRDNTAETKNIRRLVSSRNMILDYAIENHYDYVLMMDSDVMPPKNIIRELMDCKKDIVSGLYYNYFNVGKEIRLMPIAWMLLTEEEFQAIKRDYGLPENVKSRFDLRRHMTDEEASSGRLFEVLYPSAGCMLLSRKAFESLRYGLKDVDERFASGEDIYFIDEARKKGFMAYVLTKMKCEHLVMEKFEKDSDGNLIHPLWR